MKLIKEYYYKDYQPKLNKDNYAYYVDKTNCGIMYNIIEDYLYKKSRASNIPIELNVVNELIDELDMLDYFIIYFGKHGIQYDGDTVPKLEVDIFAVIHEYNIIKLAEQSLMTVN